MVEFRDRKTGQIKTKDELKAEFKNMATTLEWGQNVFDAMNVDPILTSPPATTSAYQISVRDSIVQDSKGNWVEKNIAKDMFEATSEKTKEELEKEYQASLDAEKAKEVRAERNRLLAETDWVVIRARELGQDVPKDIYDYRGDLRQLPEQKGFPHSVTFPTKPD